MIFHSMIFYNYTLNAYCIWLITPGDCGEPSMVLLLQQPLPDLPLVAADRRVPLLKWIYVATWWIQVDF